MDDPLTIEVASFLTESLKSTNDRYAMALARRSEQRFMFRYVSLRTEFDTYRQQHAGADDLTCFFGLLEEKLSPKARRVFNQAQKRQERYNHLLAHVNQMATKNKRFMKASGVETEALIIRAIIQFEMNTNKADPKWSFHSAGLNRLADDFYLLQEFLSSWGSTQFTRVCEQWSTFVLTAPERAELQGLQEAEKPKWIQKTVRPRFQPVWAFFVALCHALQEGENELTATDAFWLGLIDEVVGNNTLPYIRFLMELKPDPPPEPAPQLPADPAQQPQVEPQNLNGG